MEEKKGKHVKAFNMQLMFMLRIGVVSSATMFYSAAQNLQPLFTHLSKEILIKKTCPICPTIPGFVS